MEQEKFYPVISLCKDDLRGLFKDNIDLFKNNKKAIKIIDDMDDDEMEYFFKKFVDCLESSTFWDDLRTCFEDKYLD